MENKKLTIKKISEMTNEEIKNLNDVIVQILSNVSKTGTKYYSATIKFNSEFNRRFSLNESDFLLLQKTYNFETLVNLKGKIRIFHGIRDNGSEWYSYQLIISKDLIFSDFFTRSEVALIKIYAKECKKCIQEGYTLSGHSAVVKDKVSKPVFEYDVNEYEKKSIDEENELLSIWGE